MKVAVKNLRNGIRKCPQVIPARSNNGLGIDAHNRIVMNPYFCRLSYNTILALSTKDLSALPFKKWI